MRLFLAIRSKRMSFHAHNGACDFTVGSLGEFLARPEVARAIELSKRFGDSVHVMEWVDDENTPHKLVKQLF